jgi:hypothetical protein
MVKCCQSYPISSWVDLPHVSGFGSPIYLIRGTFDPKRSSLTSVLSSLESLSLKFQSPRSRPDRETRRPSPLKLFVIPALTSLYFKETTEFLEDLVTSIDALFNQIDFDISRLARFINRTPKLRARDAHVQFDDYCARVRLQSFNPGPGLLG